MARRSPSRSHWRNWFAMWGSQQPKRRDSALRYGQHECSGMADQSKIQMPVGEAPIEDPGDA